jgi:hypothetical protein
MGELENFKLAIGEVAYAVFKKMLIPTTRSAPTSSPRAKG